MGSSDGLKNTRGGLTRAKISEIRDVNVNRQTGTFTIGDIRFGDITVECMFNPHEYTISKSNSFREQESPNSGTSPRADFQSAGPQTLQLHLIFDAYGPDVAEEKTNSVLEISKQLWSLMAVKRSGTNSGQNRDSPPLVAFIWGSLYFVAYITQMTQKFTLFHQNGKPVRAEADITFTQYVDLDDYPQQNPTSGEGPLSRVWQVTAGDRLDLIAAAVYGNASHWRTIAQYNRLDNPAALRPGQRLLIPVQIATQRS